MVCVVVKKTKSPLDVKLVQLWKPGCRAISTERDQLGKTDCFGIAFVGVKIEPLNCQAMIDWNIVLGNSIDPIFQHSVIVFILMPYLCSNSVIMFISCHYLPAQMST